ncbi:hypothetical protein [Heyndrickxia shackletonii]|uniref:hypothetical protein n=1 Tax=Heyndrickxia shackletonii TaxID=157838 RepID=UPI001379D958|nr:hypothetical protein [Heyndrickxia shackletonii]NEZ00852.1 hypothetical protein [Heyndrickxia shackletonii]
MGTIEEESCPESGECKENGNDRGRIVPEIGRVQENGNDRGRIVPGIGRVQGKWER